MIKDKLVAVLLIIIIVIGFLFLLKDRYTISATGSAAAVVCYKLDRWTGQVWIILGDEPTRAIK